MVKAYRISTCDLKAGSATIGRQPGHKGAGGADAEQTIERICIRIEGTISCMVLDVSALRSCKSWVSTLPWP